jgi:hypothetical protein
MNMICQDPENHIAVGEGDNHGYGLKSIWSNIHHRCTRYYLNNLLQDGLGYALL